MKTAEHAIKLIVDTLPVACAFTSKIIDSGSSMQLGISSNAEIHSQLEKGHRANPDKVAAMLLNSHLKTVFSEDDYEICDVVTQIANGLHVKSGVWVPIFCDETQWGVLTVCCESDYKFNQKEINFILSIAEIISLTLHKSQAENEVPKYNENIEAAKKQWELAVDALPQLVIALNQQSKIIRVNRTAEAWGIGNVTEAKGAYIIDYLKSLANDKSDDLWVTNWKYIWQRLEGTDDLVWIGEQSQLGKIFQFTIKKVVVDNYAYSAEHCYAILIIEDITKRHDVESSLKSRAAEMELMVSRRTLELIRSNEKLEYELQTHKQDKEALRVLQQCRQDLLRELITVQETERKRIACELHDSVGQSLGATKFKVEELISYKKDILTDEEYNQFTDVVEKIKCAIDEVRHIAMDLRPSMLDDLGIEATLNWFCREFEVTYSDIKVRQLLSVNESYIPDELKVVIFRITQEAMNNVSKHAEASLIEIALSSSASGVRLSIADNGKGFNTAKQFNKKSSKCSHGSNIKICGFGLNSMCERAESTNGRFSVESLPEGGTCVRVLWITEPV